MGEKSSEAKIVFFIWDAGVFRFWDARLDLSAV